MLGGGEDDFLLRLCSEMDEDDDLWNEKKSSIKKSNKPTQEQLQSMPLQEGANVLRS
jgi:hypothetical protein